jgi:NACalpha-BTF3-like transcription factor
MFTISNALKYKELLNKKLSSIETKIKQIEGVRVVNIVKSTNETNSIVEQTEFLINIKELYSEFDIVSKEIRLVSEKIEQANHTIDLEFTPKF